MGNLYRETDVSGSEYTRCYQVVIDNPAGGLPRATFYEERVLFSAGQRARRWPSGQCELIYDSALVVPLLDPATGAQTGETATLGALYLSLYSAYLHAATARDIRNVEL